MLKEPRKFPFLLLHYSQGKENTGVNASLLTAQPPCIGINFLPYYSREGVYSMLETQAPAHPSWWSFYLFFPPGFCENGTFYSLLSQAGILLLSLFSLRKKKTLLFQLGIVEYTHLSWALPDYSPEESSPKKPKAWPLLFLAAGNLLPSFFFPGGPSLVSLVPGLSQKSLLKLVSLLSQGYSILALHSIPLGYLGVNLPCQKRKGREEV